MTAPLALAPLVRRVNDHAQQQAQQIFAATVDPTVEFLEPLLIEQQAVQLGAIIQAAQQVVGSLTTAYMGRRLHIAPPPVDPSITQRSGITKADEYQRPYWTTAKAVRDGIPPEQAALRGARRLRTLAAVDVQMAKIRQAQIVLRAAGRKTYRRVTTSDNPCSLCEIASTQIYLTDDLMPIHSSCMCDIEEDDTGGDQEKADADFNGVGDNDLQQKKIGELNESNAPASDYRDLIAVRDHGEIGPMLTWADQHFQGPQDLPAPAPKFEKPDVVQLVRGSIESKQRQLELMRKQLARAHGHDGSANFRRVYTRVERDALLERARQIALGQ